LQKAKTGARCDYALFVGASSDNYNIIREIAPHAAALKMYLNETFTTLRLTDLTVWIKVNAKVQKTRIAYRADMLDYIYFGYVD
jgi:hypothetical protein